MKKRVRMGDIARRAQVSLTTVSLVLNGVPGVRIAEDTRQRVLGAARELGYVPGPSLEALDPRRKLVFGLLINEISKAYPINLIDGMQNWADANGAQIVIQVTANIRDHETAALENLARLGVEGVVYATTFTSLVEPADGLDRFRHVLLNCRRERSRGYAVMPAERYGGTLATDHLIGLGRRRIATITGDPWQLASKERLAGYHRALNRAGLPVDPRLERIGDWSHLSGLREMRALLALPDPPDAVFCQNDLIARGVLTALREAGLSAPRDMAVVGYDDREFTTDFALSSLTVPYHDMAERALAALAGAEPLADQTVTVRGELVVRASSDESALGHDAGSAASGTLAR